MNPVAPATVLSAVISLLLVMAATTPPVAEAADALEVMGGPEMHKLVSQEQYVIALFCDDVSEGTYTVNRKNMTGFGIPK